MISVGCHGENKASNSVGNKYNIDTFLLVILPKKCPHSPPMVINVKQYMVHEYFLYFIGGARKMFGNHWFRRFTQCILVTVKALGLKLIIFTFLEERVSRCGG